MRDAKLWMAVSRIANSIVGRPFAQPSRPPESFDCISLVRHVYDSLGFGMPWFEISQKLSDVFLLPYDWWKTEPDKDYYARGAEIVGDQIELGEIYPGDLLLFAADGIEIATHAGIVVDGSQFIHATKGEGVTCPRLHDRWFRMLRGQYRIKKEYRGKF